MKEIDKERERGKEKDKKKPQIYTGNTLILRFIRRFNMKSGKIHKFKFTQKTRIFYFVTKNSYFICQYDSL